MAKLDPPWRKRITRFLQEEIATSADPHSRGHLLVGEFAGIWRYRVGDYRILCRIDEQELIVLVIDVDHRSTVYR